MQGSSLKKNIVYQILYQILILILPLVTSPYIARVIGAEGLGTYTYSYSVAYYFVLISMLGIGNYGNRAIARCRDDREELNTVFSNIVFLHFIISFICILVYVIYSFGVSQDRLYAQVQTIYVVSAFFDISWFYFGIEKFKLTVTRNTIVRVVTVILIFTIVKTADDLLKYCIIMAISSLFSQLCLWIPIRKFVHIQKPEWNKMKKHLLPMLVLFIPTIAVSLYKYMDKIMIGAMSNKEQLGYYENAEKIVNVPAVIIQSFGTVMLPKMSNLMAKKDKGQANKYMDTSMKYIMCMSIGLSFGLASVAPIFAPVFWGEKFLTSGYLIMGLSITVPFISFANIIRTQYLLPAQRDRDYLLSVIAGAIVNLLINTLLINKYGAFGAMVGTIAAEIIVCVLQTITIRRELPVIRYVKESLKFSILGIIEFLVVYYEGIAFSKNIFTLILQMLSGAAIYGILITIYFIKTKDTLFYSLASKLTIIKKMIVDK